ncbi:BON domain-containing protein [Nitrospira sp. MA-1]|nr:BON domain-containing protein [Nitrospira sp. MA-1]
MRLLMDRSRKPSCRNLWCPITFVCVLFLTFNAAGCGTHLGADAEVSDRNEQMAAEVKVALVQEAGLNAAPIDVKVQNGVVTLGGFVEKESHRQAAERAAGRVGGVQSVINHLQVK